MIKTEFFKSPTRSVLSTVLVIVIGACIVVCAIAALFAVQRYRLFKISRAIGQSRAEIASLKDTEQTVVALEEEIARVAERLAVLDSLEGYRLPVRSVIAEIERVKPRAAELKFLSFRPTGVEVIGTVPLNRIAVDFVSQLKKSPQFSETELKELKTMSGLVGLEFKIVARMARQP